MTFERGARGPLEGVQRIENRDRRGGGGAPALTHDEMPGESLRSPANARSAHVFV